MKLLFKAAGILLIVFITILIILSSTGVYTEASLLSFLQYLYTIASWKVMLFIITLLLLDLFITVPTMATVMAAGHLLGPLTGGLTATFALLVAGSLGYLISRRFGDLLLNRLSKDPVEIATTKSFFQENGVLALLFGRAVPMLPELSSCLAGISQMPYRKYILWYGLGSVPYAFALAYLGSKANPAKPFQAITFMLLCSGTLALIWFFIKKFKHKKQQHV